MRGMAERSAQRLVAAVARRLYLRRAAQLASLALFWSAGVYAAGLIAARLTGLIPDLFTLSTVGVPAATAVLIALLLARQPRPALAARATDAALGSDDLFLTAGGLRQDDGFAAVVLARAEARAAQARPAAVVPWRWQRGTGIALVVVAALGLGAWLLPQLDPFGRQAARARLDQRKQQLKEVEQAAKARIEALIATAPDEPNSKEVQAELAKLAATFQELKPDQQKLNDQKLAKLQQELGKTLADLREQQMKPVGDESEAAQRLGTATPEAMQALKEALAKGDQREAEQRVEALKDLAKKVAEATDPAAKKELQKQLKQGIEQLADQLGQPGKAAGQSLQKALDQLAQANNPELAEQAMDNLQDALQLAELELSASAQDARDLEQVKEALKALADARKANGKDGKDGKDGKGLDGKDGKECKSLADYRAMYAKLGQGAGSKDGDGPGMGQSPGRGKGGKAPENDAVENGFQTERSPSQLTAGATIMQWKAKGEAEKGVAVEDYQRAVREVQQGVSEALLKEQLPPGYHDAVKKYFDELGAEAPAAKPVP